MSKVFHVNFGISGYRIGNQVPLVVKYRHTSQGHFPYLRSLLKSLRYQGICKILYSVVMDSNSLEFEIL